METLSTTLANIRADKNGYNRYWFHAGFWVCLSYRVRRLRKYGAKYWLLLLPLDIVFGFIRRLLCDCKIPADVSIGPGLYLPHPNGVIINDLVTLGANVRIFQQVTLGEWRHAAPTLEDNVEVFGGAKVFGGICIAKHCKIGANCVINRDIPAYSVTSCAVSNIKPRKDKADIMQAR